MIILLSSILLPHFPKIVEIFRKPNQFTAGLCVINSITFNSTLIQFLSNSGLCACVPPTNTYKISPKRQTIHKLFGLWTFLLVHILYSVGLLWLIICIHLIKHLRSKIVVLTVRIVLGWMLHWQQWIGFGGRLEVFYSSPLSNILIARQTFEVFLKYILLLWLTFSININHFPCRSYNEVWNRPSPSAYTEPWATILHQRRCQRDWLNCYWKWPRHAIRWDEVRQRPWECENERPYFLRQPINSN